MSWLVFLFCSFFLAYNLSVLYKTKRRVNENSFHYKRKCSVVHFNKEGVYGAKKICAMPFNWSELTASDNYEVVFYLKRMNNKIRGIYVSYLDFHRNFGRRDKNSETDKKFSRNVLTKWAVIIDWSFWNVDVCVVWTCLTIIPG